jgi:hypothetical protein
MVNFLGGVRDQAGTRGFLSIGANSVVAVNLETGEVLWRRGRIGRPLAATAAGLLTLDVIGQTPVLRVIDGATGVDAASVGDLGMPEVTSDMLTAPDAIHLRVSEVPEGIILAWSIRRAYRGGAPPPREIAAEARREEAGAVLLDLVSRTARPVATPPAALANRADVASLTSSSPDTIALSPVGDRLYALKMDAIKGMSRITLEATNRTNGSTLWRTVLDQHDPERPGPIRK